VTVVRDVADGSLTGRELEVLRLVAAGATNPAIAEVLHLSENTVRTYLRRIMGKLDCHTRSEAAAIAAAQGLL
jgi:DNA-binding CsgD family transcriptional regulator